MQKIRSISIALFLCALVPLWPCFPSFTTVVSALQIKLFMQNKAKFRKSQMNVNKVLTKDYEKKTLGERGKKQSQTNPNKAKFKKAKMNISTFITMNYEQKTTNYELIKTKPNFETTKTNTNLFAAKDYERNAILGSDKTNPNKPNQTQCLPAISVAGLPAICVAGQRQKMLLRLTIPYYNGRNAIIELPYRPTLLF